MTISIKLPEGWQGYHETHTPFFPEGGGVLWVPNELADNQKVVLEERPTDDEFIQALIAAMATPIEEEDVD